MRGRQIPFLALVVAALAVMLPGEASAQVPAAEQLRVVRLILPEGAHAGLEFVLPSDDGDTLYQAGTGDWICRGDRPGDDRLSLSCYTRSAAPFLDRQRELIAEGMRSADMRARLDAEARAGELPLPAFGLELSLSGALGESGAMPDEVSVYHLLYIPFATPATIGLSDIAPEDPAVPYLHRAGTHEAHVMWMKTVRVQPGAGDS